LLFTFAQQGIKKELFFCFNTQEPAGKTRIGKIQLRGFYQLLPEVLVIGSEQKDNT